MSMTVCYVEGITIPIASEWPDPPPLTVLLMRVRAHIMDSETLLGGTDTITSFKLVQLPAV